MSYSKNCFNQYHLRENKRDGKKQHIISISSWIIKIERGFNPFVHKYPVRRIQLQRDIMQLLRLLLLRIVIGHLMLLELNR
jgi:hypothetical protein